MEKQPDWVPDWVWNDYRGFQRRYERWLDIPSRRSLAPVGTHAQNVARSIVFDEGCGQVWATLHRHADIYQQRWNANQLGLPEGIRQGDPRQFVDLMHNACQAMLDPYPHDVTPSSERKERGCRIARLVSELRSELNTCSKQQWGLPREFDKAINDTSEKVAASFTAEEISFRQAFEIEASADPKNDEQMVTNGARLAMGRNTHSDQEHPKFWALDAIESGAIAWSKTEPIMYRPNDPNAQRLYFIRAMTAAFRDAYGKPFRAVTASLTRCLFQCEIDPATITKLAP